jgi:hypothetical protein
LSGPTTRQCVGCGTALPEETRSPRCPRCRAERERTRNLEKVHAFRQRTRDFLYTLNGPKGPHLPTRYELSWLFWLQLDLYDPVHNLCAHIRAGRAPYHDQVLGWAKVALDRYDRQRAEFDARAGRVPEIAPLWGEWRSFFEQLRAAVQ